MTVFWSNRSTSIITKILLLHLFPVFFILHGYNEKFGVIPFSALVRLFITYSIILILLFAISVLVFRNKSKAFVFSFFLLSVFFFFGFFQDLLKIIFPNNFFSSYTFILPLILLLVLFLFLVIRKGKKNISLISKYISVLLGVFVVVEVGLFVYDLATDRASKNNLSLSEIETASINRQSCSRGKPDIFFIVFDEYMSSAGLSKYFSFNNSVVDSLFTSTGFYISEGSKSNYNMTPLSLASTLNFNYLDLEKRDSFVSHKIFLKAIKSFEDNRLSSFLAEQGYDIIDYGCFALKGAELHVKPYFESLPADMINNQTIIFRIKRDIGWFFSIRNIFTGQYRIPSSYRRNKEYHLYRNSFNAGNVLNELRRSGSRPKFVYAHLMLPHDPYFLDSAGKLVSDESILLGRINKENAYLDQLRYSNKLLSKIIEAAATKTARERVVVIEGDHGYGRHDDPKFEDREFRNLNTYYFSDHDYSSLYPSISPVNTFRVILNKYFCYNFPLLKDSSFYIQQNSLK